MKDYPKFRAGDADVLELIADQRMARLVTIDAAGWPRVGLHVFTHDGLTVDVHLVKGDSQLDDLRRTGRAVVEADEILASAVSHWIDEQDAKYADQYYRTVAIQGEAELIDDRDAIAAHLRAILVRYQPDSRYAPVDATHPLYQASIGRLVLVRVHPVTTSSKFKLAQGTPPDVRQRIVDRLQERGSDLDLRTASALIRAASK